MGRGRKIATLATIDEHIALVGDSDSEFVHEYVPTILNPKGITEHAHRQSRRLLFVTLALISIILFDAEVLSGVFTTTLYGLPSISSLLAHDPILTIFAQAEITIVTFLRVCFYSLFTSWTHVTIRGKIPPSNVKKANKRLYAISVSLLILIGIQLVSFSLIPVTPLTIFETVHYVVAVITFLSTVALEILLLWRRWIIHDVFFIEIKDVGMEQVFGYADYGRLLWLNAFFILGLIVSGSVYAGYSLFVPYAEYFLPVAIAEYIMYKSALFLIVFHIMDVYTTFDPMVKAVKKFRG